MLSLEMHQQAWLQGMMSHRIVPERQAKAMFQTAVKACKIPYSPSDYDKLLKDVTNALSPVGLEVKKLVDEMHGVHLVAVINTKADGIAQMATTFTPLEIAFVKLLVSEIVTAPGHSYCLSSTNAANLGRQLESDFPSSKAEVVCSKLIRQGWLRQRDGGFYALSSRALMELRTYLVNAYKEHLHECKVCDDIVTCGVACETDGCDVYVHNPCKLRFLPEARQGSGGGKCPSCKKAWKPIDIGSTANAAATQSRRGRRGAQHTKRTRRTAEANQDGDDVKEEGGEEDVKAGAGRPLVHARRSQRAGTQQSTSQTARGKRRRIDTPEEDKKPELSDDGDSDLYGNG